jgi:hypothetical protein
VSHSFVLTMAVLATLTLSACGGDAGSTTGSTPVTPEASTVAAAPVASRPAPAPAPTSTPAPAQRDLVSVSSIAEGPGCVRLFAKGGDTSCGGTQVQPIGTRGHANAIPAAGARFLGWAASSSDCPGETTNTCSFAFDRNKAIVAQFAASAPVITKPQINCVQEFVHHWHPVLGYMSPVAQQTCPVPHIDSDCASYYGARGLYDSSAMRQNCAVWP